MHPLPILFFIAWVALCFGWTNTPFAFVVWVKTLFYFVFVVDPAIGVYLSGKRKRKMYKRVDRMVTYTLWLGVPFAVLSVLEWAYGT